MYLGPFLLPMALVSVNFPKVWQGNAEARIIVAASALLAWISVFFPQDFYVPFLKSKTFFSHLFLWLNTTGKACFITAGLHALLATVPSLKTPPHETRPESHNPEVQRWIVWGFVVWTLAMFCGEIWSYLGWGAPVVWDDAGVVLTMAVWFYFGGLLHLHLIRWWNFRRRMWAVVTGAVFVVCTTIAEWGTFRVPNLPMPGNGWW